MSKKKRIVPAVLGVSLLLFSPQSEIWINQANVAHASELSKFSDVAKSHPAYDKIMALVDRGVIEGYTDGTFRPNENVTRGQFAAFIARALELPSPKTPKKFSDVNSRVATYDGIIKAANAGIIVGYKNGSFKPNENISRGDMAIMLDRALQLNGSYKTKATLTYKDSNSIGKSSYEAIQRLTHYKIMGAHSGSNFSPAIKGNRLTTVLSIYELLSVKNLLKDKYPEGDIRNYTYEELKAEVGEWIVWKRVAGKSNGAIHVMDYVQEMYNQVRAIGNESPALQFSPERYFKEKFIAEFEEAGTPYFQGYPLYEYVAINGVPFRETQWYPEEFLTSSVVKIRLLNNTIPNPPKEEGKFLIDVPGANQDLVTYQKGNVSMEKMARVVEKAPNANDYYVDIKAVFNDTNLVSVTNNGLTISFAGKELRLANNQATATLNGSPIILSNPVKTTNGVVFVPLKSVTDALGLYWREMIYAQRWEIANYPLQKGIIGWEE